MAPYFKHPHRQELLDVHCQFHKLWTAAVGTPGYDKEEWSRLDRAIMRLAVVTQETKQDNAERCRCRM